MQQESAKLVQNYNIPIMKIIHVQAALMKVSTMKHCKNAKFA